MISTFLRNIISTSLCHCYFGIQKYGRDDLKHGLHCKWDLFSLKIVSFYLSFRMAAVQTLYREVPCARLWAVWWWFLVSTTGQDNSPHVTQPNNLPLCFHFQKEELGNGSTCFLGYHSWRTLVGPQLWPWVTPCLPHSCGNRRTSRSCQSTRLSWKL